MNLRAALLSALLLAAAAPPSPLPLLVLGALVPAALAFPAGTRLAAARGGAVLFAVHWGILLSWIPQAGIRVGAWTVAAWVALVLTLALLGALFGVLLHHLAGVRRMVLPVALPLAWVAVEIVRARLLGPLGFPWMGIAVPLTAHPAVIQAAAWVGEVGVAAGIVAVNGVLARGLRGGSVARSLGLAGAAVVAVHLAGAYRIARAAPEPVATLVAVQPAVPLEVKRGPDALAASFAALEALLPAARSAVARAGADAVVLPETALPGPVGAVAPVLTQWSRVTGVTVLAGVEGRVEGRRSNAVVAASAGAEPGDWPVAHKVRLVPGVEWSPIPGEGWARGAGPGLLTVGRARVAPLVCIESAGAWPARDQVASGADLLVNVTNDAWLAESAAWSRSPAFHQHPAHLALRSVETGRGALRVGNNGLTEVVDPLGRRTALLPPHAPGVASAEVHRLPGTTPFVSVGHLLPWLILAATLAGSTLPLPRLIGAHRGDAASR